ncbi:MAG: hypothetical protein COX02_01875 [Candidatus Vogelbacteria bacterium CG22_combo_CG10-13_8_21_14_all_37_9]|uniref:Prepilin-type N-terminal cleavage/methylation domain-containing protein n=1 Tax=Candidatus Vogelbacteria bacterium CG22_combo_CG10-13_8_21_14_all_37_9 TaxID=1975046 RepID=A0A2H0BKC9_9BACT|nr:MAG: hypothetical protein BK005_00945 [bacterium CG10_37_50]PIP58133.1 MAG: hypothetical protein COX02_01875 [Candidatus Vogelbacteria bacterium CG22_combo_CG10-13_8_21_14_all_37_9]
MKTEKFRNQKSIQVVNVRKAYTTGQVLGSPSSRFWSSPIKTDTLRVRPKLTAGFTLIELMVSVSIFIIVAFVVTGTFIVAMDAYRKAQQVQLVMDNVNYAMDAMVLEIREGTNYNPISSSEFSFKNVNQRDVSYGFENSAICRSLGTGDCSPLTDPKIATIRGLNFRLLEGISQPLMVQINVYGTVKSGKSQSDLNLQTTITQRNSD